MGRVKEIGKSLYNRSENFYPANFTVYSFVYNSGTNTTYATDALGYTTEIKVNDLGNPIKITEALGGVTTMNWDYDMNLVSLTDANGHTTSYEYDSYGNLVCQTDPTDNSTLYGWNVIDFSTDYSSLLVNTTNARGFTTIYEYDERGNLERTIDTAGNSSSFNYDASGNVISATDFRGYTTLSTYDTRGNLRNSIDATGNVTEYTYDIVGRLLKLTDANGHTITNVYDDNDRLVKVIEALGNEMIYGYNAVGSLISTINANGHKISTNNNILGRVAGITDPTGNKTSFKYDKNGNLIKYTTAKGSNTTTEYDALGRVSAIKDALGNVENYTYDAVGNLITEKDRNGGITTYAYDALNRLIKITDQLGNTITYTYDSVGNIRSIQDPNGQTTSYEYDALDRVIRITDALGNDVLLSYDANGNLLNYTDARGHSTRYDYDGLNRRTRAISPLGYQTVYTYDPVGNVISKKDANGNDTLYRYDALDRLTLTTYPDAGKIKRDYDAVGNLIQISNIGIGLNDVTQFSYDELDRLTEVTRNYGSFSKTINYTYDENGNLATMIDSDRGITTYQYDGIDRVVEIFDPYGEVTTYQYDKGGRRIAMQRPNGVKTSYYYDAANRLLSLGNKKSLEDIISSYTYTYDSLGNRLSMTEANENVTFYEYDALNRLVNVTYPSGDFTKYTYDAVGNRLSKLNSTSSVVYTYDAENRLLTANGISYAYDNNGKIVSKSDGTIYEYDYENRLTKVTLPDTSHVTYQYSANGDRLSRTNSSGTTYYLYDLEDILMELDAGGVQQARYTHGPRVDEPISMHRDGDMLYYQFDGLRSVTSLTDASEKVVALYKYDAFGSILEEVGWDVVNPYKYTCREYDENTGLYYYRARYYDAEVGRFLSKDPVWNLFDPQNSNRYVYAGNNPINRVDPFGMQVNVDYVITSVLVVGLLALVIVYLGSYLVSVIAAEAVAVASEYYNEAVALAKKFTNDVKYANQEYARWGKESVRMKEWGKGGGDPAGDIIKRVVKIGVKGGGVALIIHWLLEILQFTSIFAPENQGTGADVTSIEDWLSIDVSPEKDWYKHGESVRVAVDVKNNVEPETIWLGVSFKDPTGEYAKYDSEIIITPESANIDQNEIETFTVEWTMPNDAPVGAYKIAVNCWKDAGHNEKCTDDIEWELIFCVYDLDIITPTADNPKIAGDPSSPIEFEAKVSTGVPPIPMSIIPPQFKYPKFSAKIGDEPVNGIMRIPNPFEELIGIYTLMITPPTQDEVGSYDLSISFSLDKKYEISDYDIEYDAVIYSTGADIILIIDRSGSMTYEMSPTDSRTRISQAKVAAKSFVDVSIKNGDQVGGVDFAGETNLFLPLTLVQSQSDKDFIMNKIENVNVGEWTGTNIGDPMLDAFYELNSERAIGGNAKAAILLTDGGHNKGTYPDAVIPYYKNKGWSVHTIGFGTGEDFDEALLIKIARETGGTYHHALSITPRSFHKTIALSETEGTSHPASLSTAELQDIYNSIAGTIRGEQTISSTDGIIYPEQSASHEVFIDPSVSQATFSVNWEGSDIDLRLSRPNGAIVDGSVAQKDPDITYIEAPTYEVYSINNPSTGRWIMHLTAINVPSSGERYNIRVLSTTNLTVHIYTDKEEYSVNEPIKIITTLAKAGSPLTGAEVNATIEKPDSLKEYLLLYDDGKHDDGVAFDGVYANYYTSTKVSGSYTITVHTSGTASSEEFTRKVKKSVYVSSVPAVVISVTPTSWNTEIVCAGEDTISAFTVNLISTKEETVIVSATDLTDGYGNVIGSGNVISMPGTFVVPAGGSSVFYEWIYVPETAKTGNYTGSIVLLSTANSVNIPVTLQAKMIYMADLTLKSSDISLSPTSPTEGDSASITAIIHNIGGADAKNLTVSFFDGTSLIGNDTISVNANSSFVASTTWTAVLGDHDIKVIADSGNVIVESKETNNEASKRITVMSEFRSGVSTELGVAVDFDVLESRVGEIYDIIESDDTHIIWKFTGTTGDWAFVYADGRLVVASKVNLDLSAKDTLEKELNDVIDMLNAAGGSVSSADREHAIDHACYYASEAGVYHRIKYKFDTNFNLHLSVPQCTVKKARLDVEGYDYGSTYSNPETNGQHYYIDGEEVSGCRLTHCANSWEGISCRNKRSGTGCTGYVSLKPVRIQKNIPYGVHTIKTLDIGDEHTMYIEAYTSPATKNMVLYSDDFSIWIEKTTKSLTLDKLMSITGPCYPRTMNLESCRQKTISMYSKQPPYQLA